MQTKNAVLYNFLNKNPESMFKALINIERESLKMCIILGMPVIHGVTSSFAFG